MSLELLRFAAGLYAVATAGYLLYFARPPVPPVQTDPPGRPAAALTPGIPVAPRVAPPAPPPQASQAPPPAAARPPGAPLPANLEARRKEAEELARFLLDKLS